MNRLVPGLLMAALWVLLLYLAPPLIFWFVMTVGAAAALREFFRMAVKTPGSGTRTLAIAASLSPVLAAYAGSPAAVLTGSYLALLGLAFLVIFFYTAFADPLAFLLNAGFSVFYVSLCCAFIILLRELPDGSHWLLILTVITAGSDTGAYYAGRAFGKRKLCQPVSPKKTVNGAIGGVLAAVAAAVLLGCILLPEVSCFKMAIASVLLTAVGIVGDLTESVIKRGTGCKDSGTMLKGHGGLLDRADSLLFAAPLLYALLAWGFFA
ncbi:phosphatidate cytidylyltransferase [Candidatus Electronema sp. JM]|uniref:phosphatidate cytidylyltransferase n=1 Tax=Candidatus Electronema sp. JM TaxID=3401571 RepID=UPI003AA9D9B7